MSSVMQALGIFCVLRGHESTVQLIVQDLIYTCQHRRLVITLGEYADYYLRAYYESDGTEINYLGTNIKIEEIKGGSNL